MTSNVVETYIPSTKPTKVHGIDVMANLELGNHPNQSLQCDKIYLDQEIDSDQSLCEAIDWRGRPATTKHGGHKTSFFILVNQGLWNVAFFAVTTSLVLYFRRALQMSNAEAANNVTNWLGTTWLLTLLGGFLGDSYIGRFWTCVLFQAIHALGLIMLGICVSVDALNPAVKPDRPPTGLGTSVFFVSIYVIALGTGGYLPAFQALGADQFDTEADKTAFFGWLFFFTNIGSVVANTALVYIENEGEWALGYWLATGAGVMAFLVFGLGVRTYRQFRPGRNPFARVAQVVVATCMRWHLRVPDDSRELHEAPEKELIRQGSRKMPHTPRLRFFDKAATLAQEAELGHGHGDGAEKGKGEGNMAWKLCSVTQVEEVKCLVRMVPIWLTAIPFAIVFSQVNTLFIEQAAVMDTELWRGFTMPPASISLVNVLSIFACTVLYPWTVVPMARLVTGRQEGLTHLQRLGLGIAATAMAVAVAALVETRRLSEAAAGRQMGVTWLVPQELVLGASQVLTIVGAMDFFYREAPHSMRGLVSALSLANLALGSFGSTLLVSVTMKFSTRNGRAPGWIPPNLDDGHLDYFYWLLFCITVANATFFYLAAMWYTRFSAPPSVVSGHTTGPTTGPKSNR